MTTSLRVDGEGLSSVETEAVYREIPVESDGIVDTQTPHHRPTRPVDDGESLIGEGVSNLCGNFQIGQGGGFDPGYSAPDPVQQRLGSVHTQSA